MKLLYRVFFLLVIFMGQSVLSDTMAQSNSMKEIQRRSKRNERLLKRDESKKVKAAQDKVEKQKKEQKQKEDAAIKEGRKEHMDLQTDAAKKRMKETRMKSDENRNRTREPFFKRIFKRNKHYEG